MTKLFSNLDSLELIHDLKFHEDLEHLLQDKIISIYIYGSVVYESKPLFDDLDLIIVTKNTTIQLLKQSYNNHFQIDINAFSEEDFALWLQNHNISALECIFLPDGLFYGKRHKCEIDLKMLRSRISGTASNSFVKAKKKFSDKEHYIGKKSLWHSLRILQFGIDIAKNNQINYKAMNHHYEAIVQNPSNNYKDYLIFKPVYNELASEFRKFAK